MPTPVRKIKVGAQKCVTQRVKKWRTVVSYGLIASNDTSPKKSRTWSRAITTMTNPRSQSTASSRGRAGGATGAAGPRVSAGKRTWDIRPTSSNRDRLADRVQHVLDHLVRLHALGLALEVQDQPVPQGHRGHRP